jgi:hypothetical protein
VRNWNVERYRKKIYSQTNRLEKKTSKTLQLYHHRHEKFLFFDCPVSLYTMQNELLVISNLTWLDSNQFRIIFMSNLGLQLRKYVSRPSLLPVERKARLLIKRLKAVALSFFKSISVIGNSPCALRAQRMSTSAERRLWSLTEEQAGVGSSFLTLLKTRTSLGKAVWATSACDPGKYGNSPVGCRPKEG